MLRQMKRFAALALSLSAACAANSPATYPALAAPSSLQAVNVAGEIAPDEHGGIIGVFITDKGFDALLVGVELELGDLRLKLRRSAELLALKTIEANALIKHATTLGWRAHWGLPLGVGLGFTVAAIMAAITVAILRALPAQLMPVAQ